MYIIFGIIDPVRKNYVSVLSSFSERVMLSNVANKRITSITQHMYISTKYMHKNDYGRVRKLVILFIKYRVKHK